MGLSGDNTVLLPANFKNQTDMEVTSIERSTYEELLTSFNSFVTQMRALLSLLALHRCSGEQVRSPRSLEG